MNYVTLVDNTGRSRPMRHDVAEKALISSQKKPNLSWTLPEDSSYEFKDNKLSLRTSTKPKRAEKKKSEPLKPEQEEKEKHLDED